MKYDFRKIFVLISIIFISFMIGFYGTRLIYYYKQENRKDNKSYTLIKYITKEENLLNSTIVKDKNNYYFHKKTENNYLYYSGLMYRILYLNDKSIYAITEEVVTNLKYGQDENYDSSDIKEWLNNVYKKNLNQEYIKNITLLDKDTFYKIGEEKSYVIGNDFWVLDKNKALVVDENGNLTKTNNYSDFLGVKPVVEIDGTKDYITGDGTKENPYLLENKSNNTLNDIYVGEYIKYKNIDLRVIEKNNDGIKVLSLNKLDEKCSFSNYTNKYQLKYKSDLGYYLNNTYIKKLNKKDLIQTNWYIGEYKTTYKETEDKYINTYIGLLKIGDYFINSIPNSYLITPNNKDIYIINDKKTLYTNKTNEKLDIYPVFTLNKNLIIKSGSGYKNNPYIVGD
ncbi:MAG: hypothetical protein J6K21_04880 [Bacilli bacterium]|nr:hypothetical protein [Bacilli bacterium]